jgi:hypothetical protein
MWRARQPPIGPSSLRAAGDRAAWGSSIADSGPTSPDAAGYMVVRGRFGRPSAGVCQGCAQHAMRRLRNMGWRSEARL